MCEQGHKLQPTACQAFPAPSGEESAKLEVTKLESEKHSKKKKEFSESFFTQAAFTSWTGCHKQQWINGFKRKLDKHMRGNGIGHMD